MRVPGSFPWIGQVTRNRAVSSERRNEVSVGRNSEAHCAALPKKADYASLIRPAGSRTTVAAQRAGGEIDVGRNSEAYCAALPKKADYASLIRPAGSRTTIAAQRAGGEIDVGRNSEAYCAALPKKADYASLIRPTGSRDDGHKSNRAGGDIDHQCDQRGIVDEGDDAVRGDGAADDLVG